MIEHPLLNEIYKRGYTITGFSKKCGIDHSTIYQYIQGRKKSMHGSTINIIAENLGMPYEEVKKLCPTR